MSQLLKLTLYVCMAASHRLLDGILQLYLFVLRMKVEQKKTMLNGTLHNEIDFYNL